MAQMWQASELGDKPQILNYLRTDPLYAAYAIGDLEPGMYEQCTWAGATQGRELGALALYFRGLELPALFLMGDTDGLRAVLEEALCPPRAYLTCRSEHLSAVGDFYEWERQDSMWRMALAPGRFRPVEGTCVRLAANHVPQLAELYAVGEISAFSPAQVAQGVFYGVWSAGDLVAAAGTHLVSPTYGVAAVGNVFTHPTHRGRGYGTAVTSAVLEGLLRLGIRDVVLNVGQSNAAAIRLYERLGFQRYCPFLEGPAATRLSQTPPVP
jgi:ribosomal protein S18 acetylase RimI-like enzyme